MIVVKILEHTGITVMTFNGLRYRKLAIIYKSSVWEGSHNILDHSIYKEIMCKDELHCL